MIDRSEKSDKMREVAGLWHGGQGSPLYAYCSSGAVLQPFISREIRACLADVESGRLPPVEGQTVEGYVTELNELLTHVQSIVPEDQDD